LVALTAILFVVGMSCSPGRDPESLFAPSAGTLVVDATLIVGAPMPLVYVSQTVDASSGFDRRGAEVDSAVVTISGGTTTYPYIYVSGSGVYVPMNVGLVLPNTEYDLDVIAPDGRRVRAHTHTPAPFRVDRWVVLDDAGRHVRDLATFRAWGDSVYSRPENQIAYATGLLEAWFQRGDAPGYQAALFSTTPNSPRLINPDFVDEADLDKLPRANSSPVLEAIDGTIRLPWLAIWFSGRYVVRVYRLDRNWYDLARSDPLVSRGGFGFGGNAGEGFDRPIFHVDGGIGLFGSAAVDSVGLVILP